MFIEISIVIALIIFAVLAFYMIRTLIAMQHSLRHLDHLMKETEFKMRNFDSLLHSASNLGDVFKAATGKMKKNYFAPQLEQNYSDNRVSILADLFVAGLKLGKKFFNKE